MSTVARRGRGLGGALVALAPAALLLVLGGATLTRGALSRDEMASWGFSRLGLGALVHATRHVDAAFLPYYALLHLTPFASAHPTALRVWSLAAGAVAVALTAWTAAELWSRWAGLVAGTVLALNGAFLGLAQTARPAALSAMFAALATYLLVRARTRGGGWWLWAGYALATALGACFTLFAVLTLGAHALLAVVWWVRRDRPALLRFGVAAVVGVLLVSPLLLSTGGQRSQIGWITARSLTDGVRLVERLAGTSGAGSLVPLLALVACLVASVRSADMLVGPALLVVPAAGLWVASQILQPLEIPRYVMATPAGAALTVAGAAYALARWLQGRRVLATALAAAVLVVAAGVQVPALRTQLTIPPRAGFPGLVRTIVPELHVGQSVVFAQNFDATGRVGGFALYSHDRDFLRETWRSMPRGALLVFPRRVLSLRPFRTEGIDLPVGRVDVVGGPAYGITGSPRLFWAAKLRHSGCTLLDRPTYFVSRWECRRG